MTNILKEVRKVGDFNRIAMKGWGKVTISQGKEQSLTVDPFHDCSQKSQFD